jgi:hypothetical protein
MTNYEKYFGSAEKSVKTVCMALCPSNGKGKRLNNFGIICDGNKTPSECRIC